MVCVQNKDVSYTYRRQCVYQWYVYRTRTYHTRIAGSVCTSGMCTEQGHIIHVSPAVCVQVVCVQNKDVSYTYRRQCVYKWYVYRTRTYHTRIAGSVCTSGMCTEQGRIIHVSPVVEELSVGIRSSKTHR